MPKSTQWTRCTAQSEDGSFCDAPSIDGAPFPICIRHGAQLLRFFQAELNGIEHAPFTRKLEVLNSMRDGKADLERRLREDAERMPTERVYYVLVGKLIKIGYTTQLRKRMATYPPDRKILAIEDGGMNLEAQRLRQFRASLAHGKEWFRPTPDLIDHINRLRKLQNARPLSGVA